MKKYLRGDNESIPIIHPRSWIARKPLLSHNAMALRENERRKKGKGVNDEAA
jgi:hypothetical protein